MNHETVLEYQGVFQKWIKVVRWSHLVARGDLTEAQWAVLEPLLPKGIKSSAHQSAPSGS